MTAPLSFGHFPRERGQPFRPTPPGIPCECRFAHFASPSLREREFQVKGAILPGFSCLLTRFHASRSSSSRRVAHSRTIQRIRVGNRPEANDV